MIDVGIVMPVYIQKPEYLKMALTSIVSQEYKNFRLIVVIDGAPQMKQIVQEVVQGDHRVEIVNLETNQGVSKALNQGFGILFDDPNIQYLTWVSSDNIYYPCFIGTLRTKLLQSPEKVGIVNSSFRSIDKNGNYIESEAELATRRNYIAQPIEVLLDGSIVGASFMYKSKYAKKIQGYYLEPVEDYDYWLRLTEHCDMITIPKELMEYRVNSEFSISSTLKTVEKHREWRYAFHLARHQARTRLNIPAELTVLMALEKIGPTTIERIENLYEQSFSNYHFHVLDLSNDQQVTKKVSKISHPCTNFRRMSHLSKRKAVIVALQQVTTPFVFLLNHQKFLEPWDFQALVNELRKANESIISYYFTNNHQLVGRSHPPQNERLCNELFRTSKLLNILFCPLTKARYLRQFLNTLELRKGYLL